jgi:2-oxoacid:acceptor oxidoreductase gamma subunit (pyruvate/2-ketoisovalerate family)/2-oxoacid:acceptor oxidoreductase delta subunit (pyruvate/2-ketoisovalerate family)
MGEIRIHGRGGQGTVVAAEWLAAAFVLDGKFVASFPSFGQERRGVPVAAFLRFDEAPVRERTRVYHPEFVLVFDRVLAAFPECYAGLKDGGMAVLNTKEEEVVPPSVTNLGSCATVDATRIALQEIGRPIPNTCMLGAFARASGLLSLDVLTRAMERFLKGDVLARNRRSMERGFHEATVKSRTPVGDDKRGAFHPPRPRDGSKPIPFESKFESPWADAHKMLTIHTGDWRFQVPVLDKETCRQCGWCQISCPVGCLQPGPDGYFHPDLNYCKGCGICAHECPAYAIRMVKEEVV